MGEATDDTAPTVVSKRPGRQADAEPLSAGSRAVLRALADAEESGEPRPTFDDLAALCGYEQGAQARARMLDLSDRRLIDGFGTARRLTEAGWETLEGEG